MSYTASDGGQIEGTTPQNVQHGNDGEEVKAVADAGYHFVQRSDGLAADTRKETAVKENKTLVAEFKGDLYALQIAINPQGPQGVGATVIDADSGKELSDEVSHAQRLAVNPMRVANYVPTVAVEGATDDGDGTFTVVGGVTVTYTEKGTGRYTLTVVTNPVDLQGAGIEAFEADGSLFSGTTFTLGQIIRVAAKVVQGYDAVVDCVEGVQFNSDGSCMVTGNVTISVTYTPIPVPPQPATATLVFNVTDASGAAVQNAKVTLEGIADAKTAGAQGKAAFEGLELKEYGYTVEKSGYKTASGKVALGEQGAAVAVKLVKEQNEKDPSPVESSLLAAVQLYPNPFSDNLQLLNADYVTLVEVFSVCGQEVYSASHDGSSSITVDTHGWSAGLYLVRLTAIDGVRTLRVVKR